MTMPMVMFQLNKWVKCVNGEHRGQKCLIIMVNDDGSARARLNKQPSKVVVLWPEDCEPM